MYAQRRFPPLPPWIESRWMQVRIVRNDTYFHPSPPRILRRHPFPTHTYRPLYQSDSLSDSPIPHSRTQRSLQYPASSSYRVPHSRVTHKPALIQAHGYLIVYTPHPSHTISLLHGRCENRKVPPQKIPFSSSSPTFLRYTDRVPTNLLLLTLPSISVPHVSRFPPRRLPSIYSSSCLNLTTLVGSIFPIFLQSPTRPATSSSSSYSSSDLKIFWNEGLPSSEKKIFFSSLAFRTTHFFLRFHFSFPHFVLAHFSLCFLSFSFGISWLYTTSPGGA